MTKMAHQNPVAAFLAFITGSAVSITEFISAGSVLIQSVGAVFAVLGGYWIFVYWRAKAQTQEVELKKARQEWEQSQVSQDK